MAVVVVVASGRGARRAEWSTRKRGGGSGAARRAGVLAAQRVDVGFRYRFTDPCGTLLSCLVDFLMNWARPKIFSPVTELDMKGKADPGVRGLGFPMEKGPRRRRLFIDEDL